MKKSFAVLAAMAVATAANVSAPTTAQAQETRSWRMCDWEKIPEDVLERISRRSDYEDILRRMFDFCPEAALALTERPTATVNDRDMGDDQRGREPDDTPPTTPTDPDDEPDDETPDEEDPEDDDPEDDDPEDEGPDDDFGLPA